MHAAEDAKKKEEIEAKNIAEQMIYTAEKALKDNGDKVPADVKTSVEAKITALKAVKDTGSMEDIKKATTELSTEMSKIGEVMQKAAGAQTPPKDTPPEGNVRDAEAK